MTQRLAVALGSNLGARLQIMREAVGALQRLGTVESVSSLYETAPVGGPEQEPYLNAVAILRTDRDPLALLEDLHRIEGQAGRVRRERWGPRRLDLDLITGRDEAGEWIRVEDERLQVPHPRAHLRRFVLEPLVEVWPDARVAAGAPARRQLESVRHQEVERLGEDWVEPRMGTARALLAAQMMVLGGYGIVLLRTGEVPDGMDAATLAGGVLAGAGAGFSLWGSWALGPALSPLPEPRPGTKLVTDGPYRLVRHPIYTGLVAATLGVAVAARSGWGVAASAAIGAFFGLKSRYEETRLRLAVAGYPAYQRRVRGRLLPRAKGPT